MLDIELNKDLLGLVKNKRVALIGPAPHLVGKNLGSYLDGYDVVCRMNQIIPLEVYRCDYGSRTDVLFHNCGTPWMPDLEKKIARSPEVFAQLKMACCLVTKADHSDVNYMSWPDDHISDVVNNFSKINVHNIPFYWIGVRDYRKIAHATNSQPYTGTMAIATLSHYPIKELLITGMSFYLDGDTQDELYIGGVCDPVQTSKRGLRGWRHGTHGGAAQNERQIELIKRAVTLSENIIIDSKINELLNLRHPRILSLSRGGS